jgi:hypothetical protein
MKRTLLLAVIVAISSSSHAIARQWTSRAGGFSVEAELVDVRDGNVILKKADGSQVSVPLNKLSLGDVRYVNQELKAAESGLVGQKSESAAPGVAPAAAPAATEGPQAAAPPEAVKLSPEASALLKKLRYDWKKGQKYVYRIRIAGDRGGDTENRTGNATYTVKSSKLDEIEVTMKSDLRYEASFNARLHVLLPGRHVGFISSADGQKDATIRIDPRGRLLESDGRAPLPYLLGDLAELVIEPLSQAEQTTWTVNGDPGVAVVSLRYPYCRFSQTGFREGVPATEKTVYTVTDVSGKLVNIAKHYEMTSAASLNGKPKIEATGNGKLRFDTERGVFASLDYNIRVIVRDANKTEETPIKITYRLLSDEDIAEAEKDAQRAKEEARKAQQEKARPLSETELAKAIEDLASDDSERITTAAGLLSEKKPQAPNAKIAKALESILTTSKSAHQRTMASAALKNWATAENVPVLMKILVDDQWPPVRANVLEALTKFAPKEAIKPVAQQLLNLQTRNAAQEFLRAAGSDAEDAVLPLIEYKDQWVRGSVCELLETIGTDKCIPALEKAVADESWMVNGKARKALAAVKSRSGGGKK